MKAGSTWHRVGFLDVQEHVFRAYTPLIPPFGDEIPPKSLILKLMTQMSDAETRRQT